MSLIKEFFIALASYSDALSLLFHRKIRIFLLIPILINILLIVGGYRLLGLWANDLSDYLSQFVDVASWDFLGSSYIDDIFRLGFHIIFRILWFFFIAFYGGFLVIILMSPFFSLLSERVENLKTGRKYPFSIYILFRDVLRGIGIALRNGVLQLLVMIIVFFVGMIPVVGFIAPILLFVSSAYFYGFSFMDFALERRFTTIKSSVAFIRKHRVAAFVNGAVFSLSLLLPLCNVFFASFIAILAVIAATITMIKIEGKALQR